MSTNWTLTIDCAEPGKLARFWALALGYVDRPPPAGFATWEDWFAHHEVPEAEWDDGAFLSDPDGVAPAISFLKVPEGKVAKNRLHIDVQAGGGRQTPWEVRWPRAERAAERLVAAGATIVHRYEAQGRPDHFWMADPEGNEFCVL